MAVRRMADVASAFEEGRWHLQRFYKGALTAGDRHWQDWSFGAGQPSYDARIGTAAAFNPYIAQRNDAIYFPGINPNQSRHLTHLNLRTEASGTGQLTLDAVVYDLLGVYPLIDGDSIDEQVLDNTLTLPRYADGKGVFPVLVNHVSPIIAPATATMKYVDTNTEQTVTIGVHLTGQNRVVSGIGGTTSVGCLSLPLAAGSLGVKQVNSIQFNSAPGGLFAIYLIKPITTIMNCDANSTNDKIATEKEIAFMNAYHMPIIYDGAWLGMFLRPNGSARIINSVFGHMTFIWN